MISNLAALGLDIGVTIWSFAIGLEVFNLRSKRPACLPYPGFSTGLAPAPSATAEYASLFFHLIQLLSCASLEGIDAVLYLILRHTCGCRYYMPSVVDGTVEFWMKFFRFSPVRKTHSLLADSIVGSSSHRKGEGIPGNLSGKDCRLGFDKNPTPAPEFWRLLIVHATH